jgi:hypothetical protein
VIVGRMLPSGREIAWHEAYHAAALCIAGLIPTCVRTDWPSGLEAGEVIIDRGSGGYRDPARAKDVLVSVVAGARLSLWWPGRSLRASGAGVGRTSRSTRGWWPRVPAATL